MIIEFGLPTGAGGMAAAGEAGKIRGYLKKWCELHNVQVCIRTNRHDHRHWLEVEFLSDKHYTLFCLSWDYPTFMRYKEVPVE